LKILQLGNGGAFSPENTNSSFLIELGVDKKYLLFDCGYNVFLALLTKHKNGIIDLTKLQYVYISHMDDDHIGSLKSVIYYMYFKFGITLNILSNDHTVFEYLYDMTDNSNNNYTDGEWRSVQYFNKYKDSRIENYTWFTIAGLHSKPCYGLVIEGPFSNLCITGDTKAVNTFETVITRLSNISMNPTIIFHDYSNWDNEPNQVHACKTDIEKQYSKKFRDSLHYYHNDEPFNETWQNCENIITPELKGFQPYILTDDEAVQAYNNGLTLRRDVWPRGKNVSLVKDTKKSASLWENPLHAVIENSQFNDWKIIEGV
jgi:hypothetical protein